MTVVSWGGGEESLLSVVVVYAGGRVVVPGVYATGRR